MTPDDQHTSADAARLAAIVDNLADAVVGTDADRVITDWNPAAERLFGYSRDAVIGRHASLLVPPALREESDRVWRTAQRGLEGFIRMETERMRRDGTILDVELTMVRVDDPEGSLACSATYRDISQPKQLERDVVEQTMRLKALAIAERGRPVGLQSQSDESEHEQHLVEQVVALVRHHLEMDVAWLGELTEEAQIFHAVSGTAFDFEPGRVTPREETICTQLVAGMVPEVIPDTRREASVAQLPGVLEGVASYIGVPVRLPGGELFGTLCAAGSEPLEGLTPHDTSLLHALAAIIGEQVDHQRTRIADARAQSERAALNALLAALDARDQYTGSHSQAVVELARAVAGQLGLSTEEIEARITLACDAYHAMISDRPYRLALGREHALEELRAHAGTQFDPMVVAALLATLED